MSQQQTIPFPVKGMRAKRKPLSAPIMINLEMTAGCNIQCRHCYNFWREDPTSTKDRISIEQMDRLIDMIIEAGVYHVVLTGGEPMMNYKVYMHALKRCQAAGISTSTNSNLMLATPEKAAEMAAAGLDHVLTSIVSHDAAVNDHLMNKAGSLEIVKRGIRNVRAAGIRVSVNMIIAQSNLGHIYETGRLCKELDVQNLFATRLVPSVNVDDPEETIFHLGIEDARRALDDLYRVKEDFGLQVGSLISYPLCFLGDLPKYVELVGRGCPAQSGNRMVLNADGASHACTHEVHGYGNVFEEGIKPVFRRMQAWHDGSYRYPGCEGCPYLEICGSGCRMAAHAYSGGQMGAKDPLFVGFDQITKPFEITLPEAVMQALNDGLTVTVPERIRFREENGYYTLNVRWANAFSLPSELALFLQDRQAKKLAFGVKDLPGEAPREDLISLLFKDAVEPTDAELRKTLADRPRVGASINPFDLPTPTP